MSVDSALRGEITRSIARTFVREARGNELVIARVRVVGLIGMIGLELWLLSSAHQLGSALYGAVALTLAMAAWSVAVLAGLSRGGWWRGVPWVVTLVDGAYMGGRLGIVYAVLGREHFIVSQDLATVVGMAALLIGAGAYRLTWPDALISAAVGIGLYGVFAVVIGLHPYFHAVHLLLLVVIALTALGLTLIVDRAVRAEVTRMTVSRFLPATVVDAADADPLALITEPRALDATVLITDIRGFTRWAEHRDPLEVLGFLNRIQGALAEIVDRHGGTVDKFMGDGMLAVFGAPRPLPDHAARAVLAAREIAAEVERVGEVAVGVGVHSGRVVVGCLGSGVRLEFTVLGDTVNTASRLEAATKERGVPVLISEATAALAGGDGLTAAGSIALRGRDAALGVFTLA